MRDALLRFFGPQETRLTLAGEAIAVRTLSDEADIAALRDPSDFFWKLLVRCTFYVEDADDHKAGDSAFTDADIETLKRAPRVLMLPLAQAVRDVNGLDLYGEVKNSEADPSAG